MPPVRVLFLTRDSLYTRDFLAGFLGGGGEGADGHGRSGPGSRAGWELAGICLSTVALRRGRPGFGDTLELVRTVGLRYALYLGWVAEVAPRILTTGPSPVAVARRNGIPLHRTGDVNGADTVAWIREVAPDLLVTAHFNQRIAAEVLALPRMGGVNVHPSPLPAYAGVDPVTFALREGAEELGITVHLLTPELDGGDILRQERVRPLAGGVLANSRALFRRGGEMAREVVEDFPGALANRRPQLREGRSYYGWDRVKGAP